MAGLIEVNNLAGECPVFIPYNLTVFSLSSKNCLNVMHLYIKEKGENMLSFKEYVASKDLQETAPDISTQVARAGNMIAAKNPKVVPGMTPPKLVKQALISDPNVEKIIQKNPTAAGGVGAYLGGPAAAKALGMN